MDGNDEDTEDTTMLVQIEEVNRTIRSHTDAAVCDKTVPGRFPQRQDSKSN